MATRLLASLLFSFYPFPPFLFVCRLAFVLQPQLSFHLLYSSHAPPQRLLIILPLADKVTPISQPAPPRQPSTYASFTQHSASPSDEFLLRSSHLLLFSAPTPYILCPTPYILCPTPYILHPLVSVTNINTHSINTLLLQPLRLFSVTH